MCFICKWFANGNDDIASHFFISSSASPLSAVSTEPENGYSEDNGHALYSSDVLSAKTSLPNTSAESARPNKPIHKQLSSPGNTSDSNARNESNGSGSQLCNVSKPNGIIKFPSVPFSSTGSNLSNRLNNRNRQAKVLNSYGVFNVQGLCPQTKPSKVPYIKDILSDQEHVFFALTETWLDDNYLQAKLDIVGYSMFCSDRQRVKSKHSRLSEGVCIYVRDDCASTFNPVIKFSNGVVELLALHSKSLNLCIIVIYRQPDQFNGYRSIASHFKEALDKISEYLSTIEPRLPNVVFCGDFNIPNANWRKDVSNNKGLSGQEKKMFEMVNDLCINVGLNQVVNASTHVGGNTLDLVFTNNEFLCHSICLQGVSRSLSHHKVIEVNTNFCFGEVISKPSPPP